MGAYSDEELALIGAVAAPRKPLPTQAPPAQNNDLSALTDYEGEPAASKPAAPIPQKAAVVVNPNSPFSPEEQALMSSVPQSPQATVATNAGEASGSSELDAIPDSPLSVMDRAMMGWLRTPQEQKRFLDAYYPDSKLVRNEDGGQSWAIQAKDGKWYQADPNLHWSKLPGESNDAAEGRTLSNMAGKVGQTLGEYGIRSFAAAQGGAAGVAAGVPLGPIGMVAGGLIGAAASSAGTEAMDLASRKALTGRTPYGDNPEAVAQQLKASAIFGMADFALGKVLHAGAKVVTKVFGKALGALAGTEEGKVTARKILGSMGANEGLTEARLMDPAQTAEYDTMARADADKGLFGGQLDKTENDVFQSLHEDMQSALAREQGEFAKMQADPKVLNLKVDNSQIAQDPLNALKQNQIVGGDGRLIPMNQGGVYGEGDAKVIGYLRALANKEGTQAMSYKDVRGEVQKIGTLLNGKIQNQYLKQLLTQTKKAMNESVIKGLGDETGSQYQALLNKYSTVRQTMEDLGNVTEGQKKYAFVGKLVNTEKRTVARDLISGLQEVGVSTDNMIRLLQIQSAREAAPLFTRVGVKGVKFPIPVPTASRVASGVGGAYDAMAQFREGVAGNLPYADKALQFMKSLPPEKFRQVMTNQQLFDQLASTAVSGYVGQKTETQQLLKTAGIPDEP